MTVIVYDKKTGTLASDSWVTLGAVRTGTARKITKSNGYLAGGAGNLSDVTLFLDTIDNLKANDLVSFAIDKEAGFSAISAILITPDNKVKVMDETGYFSEMEDDFFAVGSGADIAYGALEMGATAEEAVEVCKRRHTQIGGDTQVVRLTPTKNK